MNKKKTNVVQSILFILLLVVTGLVVLYLSESMNHDNSGFYEKEERKISMMVQESGYTRGLERMIKKILVEENIRIDVQVIPDNQADNIIRMKINTGTVPELVDYSVPGIYGLANPTMYLENLSNESWVERLRHPEYIQYENDYIYAFPIQSSLGLGGIIYNKEVFQEYGLKEPDNTEEFYTICNMLLAKKVEPILMCSDKQVPQKWMNYSIPIALGGNQNCIDTVNQIQNKQKTLLDFPELELVLDEYLRLFQKGYVNTDFNAISYDEMLERFAQNQGAMMMGDYQTITDLQNVKKDVELGMFPIPSSYNYKQEMVTPIESKGFAIFKDSMNKSIAKEVLELWSTPEYLELWFMDYGGIPAFVDVESSALEPEMLLAYEEVVEKKKKMYEFTNFMLPFHNVHTTKLWLYYMEAPIRGLSAVDVWKQFQNDIDEYMEN